MTLFFHRDTWRKVLKTLNTLCIIYIVRQIQFDKHTPLVYKCGWHSTTYQTELHSLCSQKQQHQVRSYKRPVRLKRYQWAGDFQIKSIGQTHLWDSIERHFSSIQFQDFFQRKVKILFTVSSGQQLIGMICINVLIFSGGILNKHQRPWPEMILLRTVWF